MDIRFSTTTLDTATRAWIEEESRRTGAPVEAVIARLIQRGLAAESGAGTAPRYHDLDELAGTWSADEADAFRASIGDFARIDPALWR
jgi:hypothetical protein